MDHNVGSEEEIQKAARKKMRDLFLSKPVLERLEPVIAEQKWVLAGRPNARDHVKLLPEYCYNIFDLYGRTLFKTFFPVSETFHPKNPGKLPECKTFYETKQALDIDWLKAGSVSGSGLRVVQFIEQQFVEKIEELGFEKLSDKEMEEFESLAVGTAWLEDQISKIQAQNPGKSIEEIGEGLMGNQAESIKNLGPNLLNLAFEYGPDAVVELKKGEAAGMTGFLDVQGNIKGEQKLKHSDTYELLLLAWPEIDAMIKADPQQRMEDLWDWLSPLSYAEWIEIQDLDQLVSLCRSIKLKLKKPGAPRKPKKC